MDKTTLDSLKTAFNIAPSPDLAKAIVLGSIESHESDISAYINALDMQMLNDEERLQLGSFLIEQNTPDDAITFLDDTIPAEMKLLVDAYVALHQDDKASPLYQRLTNAHPEYKSNELDARLQPSHPEEDTRPKLRIVEKNTDDNADIAQLAKYRQKTTTFKDVVGLTIIKKQIHKKIILPFQKPSLFQRFKKKVGGGVLLFGPPGCGKTLLARATAGECNASFYNIEISDVLDMYIGESEQKLHAIFEKARNDTPCVLFFDELEALAGKREYNKGNSSNIVSQFLTELDGFSQDNEGVLVLASTNVPWSIDSAFLRPGRFDRMFFVPPPDKEAREAILKHYLDDKPTEGKINHAALAAKTGGFSGADLENLIDMATDEAIDEMLESENEVNISFAHLKTALEDCRATTIEWLTTARNYARYANDGGRYNDVLEFLKKHGK